MSSKIKYTMILIVALLLSAGCGGGGGGGDSTPVEPPPAKQKIDVTGRVDLVPGAFTDQILDQKVGPTGGTIQVTTGPLTGLKIVVPEGAVDEDVGFNISYSDVTSLDGLADGLQHGDKVIRIGALGSDKWNEYKTFRHPIIITLPYSGFDDNVYEDSIRPYFLDPELSSFESDGFISIDKEKDLVTFSTMTLTTATLSTGRGSVSISDASFIDIYNAHSDYLMMGINARKFSDLLGGASLDTNFRPSKNGFYIPNMGSFFHDATEGACLGMSIFAKYYFQKGYSPILHSNYRDPEPTDTWLDDRTAIELASLVQYRANAYEIRDEEYVQSNQSDSALTIIGTILTTGKPTGVSLRQYRSNGTWGDDAHAILAYQVDISDKGFIFHVYDPNHRADDTRVIKFDILENGNGQWNLYHGGTNSANVNDGTVYNMFYDVGYRGGYSPETLDKLKKLADKDFTGDDRFPTFTLKKITEKGTHEVIFDADNPDQTSDEEVGVASSGQKMYIAKDSAVIIEGTVIGGAAQEEGSVVDNLNVRVEGDDYDFPINNAVGSGDGSFSFTLPLLSGENSVAMIAMQKDSHFYNWAAFDLQIIKSEYRPAALSATLTWGAGDSDIDLWVTEPGGDKVGYSHRKGADSETPYLDFDNTGGYGPEHYVALDGMSVPGSADGLFGTYNIIANYYSDDDADYEHDRAIPWTITWRHLDYCYAPCENLDDDGVWVTGSESGVLTSVGQNSAPIVIDYETGDPEDYDISAMQHPVTLP